MKILSQLLTAILLSASLFGQDNVNIKFGNVSAKDFTLEKSPVIDSNTNAVILTNIGSTNFIGVEHYWISYVHKKYVRIKVINEKALDIATVNIHLFGRDEDKDKLEDLKAVTYNFEDGEIKTSELSKSDIFEDKLSPYATVTKFTLPSVKAGSMIEYSYSIISHHSYAIPEWYFQDSQYPCLYSEYKITFPDALPYITLRYGSDSFFVKKTTKVKNNHYNIGSVSVTSNDVTKLVDGQAQYSALTTPRGTVVDDLLVYRLAADHLLLVVNAGTTEKDWAWITAQKRDDSVELNNVSKDYSQIAIQGPDALGILQLLTELPLAEIKYYHFTQGSVDGIPAIVSRTGYTGEDGFEVYAAPEHAEQLWNKMLDAGHFGDSTGIIPCGLAARNTLRLEAGMALYGNDIDETTNLLEANLGWICKLDKGDFVGRDALAKEKEAGITRRLVGFEVTDRGIARDHQNVVVDDKVVGQVTSGSPAPYLKKNIGFAYVPIELASVGQQLKIDVRGRLVDAQVVKTPFYKRAR